MNGLVRRACAVLGFFFILISTVSAVWPTPASHPAESRPFVITPSPEPATPTVPVATATDDTNTHEHDRANRRAVADDTADQHNRANYGSVADQHNRANHSSVADQHNRAIGTQEPTEHDRALTDGIARARDTGTDGDERATRSDANRRGYRYCAADGHSGHSGTFRDEPTQTDLRARQSRPGRQ